MRKILIVSLIILLALTACGRPGNNASSDDKGGEGEEHTIRVTYLVSEEQSSHIVAETFKENIEKESDGRLKVELYPSGQLYGSDREGIEAVQLGNVEMIIAPTAPLTAFDKKFMIFDLPFIFSNHEEAYSVLDGELGQELLDGLEESGFKGLVYAENGFRHTSNNKGPIEKPEDTAGLKLRTMESPLHTDSFKSFGANASPFAYGELYTALQQGTYDAMESPISLYYTDKFYEVQDYLTLTGHFYAATVLLMNNDFYNGLPEDLQELIDEESVKYRDAQRELAQEQDVEWLEELKEFGMEVNELTDDQLEDFREASQSVYEKYTSEIGEDVVEKVLESSK